MLPTKIATTYIVTEPQQFATDKLQKRKRQNTDKKRRFNMSVTQCDSYLKVLNRSESASKEWKLVYY